MIFGRGRDVQPQTFLVGVAHLASEDAILIYGDLLDAALAEDLRSQTLDREDHLALRIGARITCSTLSREGEREIADIWPSLQPGGSHELALEDEGYFYSVDHLDVSSAPGSLAPAGIDYLLLKSRRELNRQIADLERALFLLAVAGLMLALLSALLVSKALARPIRDLVAFVEEFAAGNTERRINTGQFHGEFPTLASAFDDMQISLLQSNRQMIESERQYRTLIENSSQAITGLDVQTGRIFAANRSFARMLGYSKQELENVTLQQCFFPEDLTEAEILLLSLDAQGKVAQEVRMRGKGGDKIYVDLHMSIVERHPKTTAVAIFSDETEKRQLTRQLLQAQKMECVGTLASGVAHDFNNLLTAITGFTYMAQQEVQPGESLADYLAQIETAAKQAENLTHNLLAFGRQTEMRPALVDLNRIVKQSAALLSRTVAKSIEMETDLCEALDVVEVDASAVQQIIMNLCVNARDAMPGGGSIRIATRNCHLDEADCRRFDHATPGDYVSLAVSDTGIGMDASVQARIFEPFFTTKALGKGTGLGLAIVYGVVNANKGLMELESKVGEGTTFTIYFPIVDQEVTVARLPTHAELRGGKERILLVDDEPSIRRLVLDSLGQLGYQMRSANDGREALQRVREAQFDLLIIDLVMPEMSGRELLETLNAMGYSSRTLMISGYSIGEHADDLIAQGADAFLAKPFRPDDLARSVRQILDRD